MGNTIWTESPKAMLFKRCDFGFCILIRVHRCPCVAHSIPLVPAEESRNGIGHRWTRIHTDRKSAIHFQTGCGDEAGAADLTLPEHPGVSQRIAARLRIDA